MTSNFLDPEGRVSEAYVQESFHSYLKSSLAQAKAERLVDVATLSSAEGDLMITGPALCLFFAALRCTTSPASVPLPRINKSGPQLDLSEDNCPKPFIAFLQLWALSVPPIQNLIPEHQHDLARIICGLEPVSHPANPNLGRIAADLRAVAIEISLRRSFQDRYAGDLQAALDAGSSTGLHAKASFVPPPEYSPSPTASSFSAKTQPAQPPQPPPRSPRPRPGPISTDTPGPHSPGPISASLRTPTGPAIELIRETLYAALADVIAETPSLRGVLAVDAPRAYFGAVALAILSVARTSLTPDGGVRGVLGQELTLEACPVELRPFMMELAAIGRHANEIEDQDTEEAMKHAERGEDIPAPRLERVRMMLEKGAGHEGRRDEERAGRASVEGRAVAFANRINALALGMTRLRAFRERQDEVFKVLSGVS
ncbi:hypothetical protein OF83DRAFT_1086047 [Amylostereum chailletii]|nr:hypothetical protein OF83DRAFT_1086047 [Amylostereum chailletii]